MFSRTAAIIPQWLVKSILKYAEIYVFENYCASIRGTIILKYEW
jgi:hypothetical protein